jgi:hypothetical protein
MANPGGHQDPRGFLFLSLSGLADYALANSDTLYYPPGRESAIHESANPLIP